MISQQQKKKTNKQTNKQGIYKREKINCLSFILTQTTFFQRTLTSHILIKKRKSFVILNKRRKKNYLFSPYTDLFKGKTYFTPSLTHQVDFYRVLNIIMSVIISFNVKIICKGNYKLFFLLYNYQLSINYRIVFFFFFFFCNISNGKTLVSRG